LTGADFPDTRRTSRIELSAIVLCYRAEESVVSVIEPLYGQLREAGVAFELILVANYDAGEGDPTPGIVEDFARSRPDVRTVIREKKGGMGWDMRSGFEAAQGAVMVVIDGDAQNPVDDVLRMYGEMKRTGAHVMKGRRVARFDGLYRRFVSAVYNVLFRLVFRTSGISDINAKPKGLTRRAYEQMDLRSDDWFIDAEIVLGATRAGLRIGELPVVFYRNEKRASFVRPSAIWEFLVNMARYRLKELP
jgi:glycosyltransferase involved in cell wall biosynthesis